MPKILANGIQIHYQRKGTGPDVVLLHGITANLAMWFTKVFPELAKEYRVTAYDLRGHGRSDLPVCGYDSHTMTQDLLGLLDALGIEKARFVGHSFGGAVAMHLALLHPERVEGIVLLDSGLACLRYRRNIENWPGWEKFKTQLETYGMSHERFVSTDKGQDVSEIFRKSFEVPIVFGFRKGTSRATPRFQKLVNETTLGWEFRETAGMTEERLTEITAPVLALYGATSPYVGVAEHLKTIVPNCRFETLPDDGHFYLLRDPAIALDRISSFLTDPAAYVRREATPEQPEDLLNSSSLAETLPEDAVKR
jgi:pimeloyl-ACP methyl ester carboxylesterase